MSVGVRQRIRKLFEDNFANFLLFFFDAAESVYVTYPQTVGGVVGQGKVYGADSQASKSPITVVYMGGVYTEANGMVTDFAECHSVSLHLLYLEPSQYY